jgi:hypothetical protein
MDGAGFSETLVPMYQNTQRHDPEHRNLHTQHGGNLKPHIRKAEYNWVYETCSTKKNV